MYKLVPVCIVGMAWFVATSHADNMHIGAPTNQNQEIMGQLLWAETIKNPEKFSDDVKESLQKLEELSESKYKQKVVKVNKVTTQIVAGSLTKIDFDVAYTNCRKTTYVADCKLLEDRPVRHCHSEIWKRPWLEKNAKRITITCNDDSTKPACGLPGGVCLLDESTHHIQLIQESLQKLELLSPNKHRQKVVKVSNITTQVVSGFLTKIDFDVAYTKCLSKQLYVEDCELLEERPVRQCHSEIWERPWLKKDGKQIKVTCNDNPKNPTCGFGGVCDVDASAHYIQLAQESLQQLEELTKSVYKQKVLYITSVKSRVLSGIRTKIDFHAAYTNCLHSDHKKDVDFDCELLTDKSTRVCHAEIFEWPWLIKDDKKITVNCYDSEKPI